MVSDAGDEVAGDSLAVCAGAHAIAASSANPHGDETLPNATDPGNDLEILTRTASIRDLGFPNDSGFSPGSGSHARDLPDP